LPINGNACQTLPKGSRAGSISGTGTKTRYSSITTEGTPKYTYSNSFSI
jgi:hypothetical protein